MIIFNTIKAAQHYVKWCQKNLDYNRGHYEWSAVSTYIDKNLVLQSYSGDTCGCGCDTGRFCNVSVIGRIKAFDNKSIRDSKIKKIFQ